jgi:DNA-binding transcriptional regulator of glucitol operon
MDTRVWLSRRALRLHLVILIVVPGFMALCIWQITRALDGNSLSWAYVFEWPLFAAYAIYMWWRLVHEGSAEEPPVVAADGAAHSAGSADAQDGLARQHDEKEDAEDAELAAYNDYLAQLAERDKAAGH